MRASASGPAPNPALGIRSFRQEKRADAPFFSPVALARITKSTQATNFGRLLGLRAFYWHGMKSDFGDTDPIQGWGGEAQFNLNSGPGVLPYLLAGAGQIDFRNAYKDRQGNTPDDKTSLIAGTGLGFSVADRFRINASVRDFMFSETDLDRTSNPDQIQHNILYAAGFTFAIGGTSESRDIDALGRPLSRRETMERTESGTEYVAVGPATESREQPTSGTREVEPDIGSTERSAIGVRPNGEAAATVEPGSIRTPQGDRVMMVPVPDQGEIYIRFGEPGAVDILSTLTTSDTEGGTTITRGSSASTAMSGMMEHPMPGMAQPQPQAQSQPPQPPPSSPGLTRAEVDEMISSRIGTLEDRLLSRLDRLDERISETASAENRTPATSTVPAPEASSGETGNRPTSGVEERQPSFSTSGPSTGWSVHSLEGYTGLNLEEPVQGLIGGRVNLGPVTPRSSFQFLPELAIGLFNHSSFMLAGNLRYDLGTWGGDFALTPYLQGGLGILSFSEKPEDRDQTQAVLNLSYGFRKDFRNFTGFMEHQGVDLFSLQRLLIGIDWRMGQGTY
ncbi:MAG: hypothetical protein QUU85_05740 [Candidatus Eisenbacteria bacterium]|nr:hypothetical protein [Candidatus Eisenbacteria bacterium]